MPDPVFRSSEGRTPRSAKSIADQDDVDTASPDFREADTDEILTDAPDQDEIDTETPESEEDEKPDEPPKEIYEERPPTNVVRPAAVKKAGGCAKTLSMIVGTIAFSILALLIVIIYFAFYYQPADSTF